MNQITFQDVNQSSTSASFKKGQRGQTPDGREWVYVKAQSAVTAFTVVVPDAVTAVDTVSSSTDALGRIVYITKAAAGWTVGQFEDAIGVVDDGTGVGQVFKIRANTATTLELYPESALVTALSVVDSDITIRTMAEVDMAAVTVKVQSAVGIAQIAIAAGSYAWVLTNGDGGVFAGEVLTVGGGFTTGDNTIGYVQKNVATETSITAQYLGFCLVANAGADQETLVRVDIR
jgi:hypothetical protein